MLRLPFPFGDGGLYSGPEGTAFTRVSPTPEQIRAAEAAAAARLAAAAEATGDIPRDPKPAPRATY